MKRKILTTLTTAVLFCVPLTVMAAPDYEEATIVAVKILHEQDKPKLGCVAIQFRSGPYLSGDYFVNPESPTQRELVAALISAKLANKTVTIVPYDSAKVPQKKQIAAILRKCGQPNIPDDLGGINQSVLRGIYITPRTKITMGQ